MKKNVIVLIILLCGIGIHAQDSELKKLIGSVNNFNSIDSIAQNYFNIHPDLKIKNINTEDNFYLKYNRWAYYWRARVNADGTFPDPKVKWDLYKNLQTSKTRGATWGNISQTTSISGYNGMGRLLSVAFSPTDSNTMYVAAPKGGIWKTIDGGNSWKSIGDNLPVLNCGKVIIDKNNPGTLYASLGERPGWWEYSMGIYKTTNDGATWQATGQAYNFSDQVAIFDIAMATNNSNILFSGQSNGLFKSTDAGTTWTLIASGEYKQIEFMPNSDSTFYTVKYSSTVASQIMKSTNLGSSLTQASNFSIVSNKIHIAVTKADPNFLVATFNNGTIFKCYTSSNAGSTFTFKSDITANDYVGISNTNKNKIYYGAVVVYASTDGGSSFNQITNWYNSGTYTAVHADLHYIAPNPLTNKMFFCNDGGLYKFNESNSKWKDLSNGLVITQFYKIAVAQIDTSFIIGGTQDNGGRQRLSNGNWTETNGGDAMCQGIDKDNDQTIYTTYTYGQLYRSYDRWAADQYFDITPDPNENGDWIAPFELAPSNNNTIVAGYNNIFASTDQGNSWNKLTNNSTNATPYTHIAIAPNNTNYIYACNGARIFTTKNFGTTWTSKGIANAGVNVNISSLCIHPKNEEIVYYTKSGYGDKRKIYKSLDAGLTYNNISYNLPNMPVNAMVIDDGTDSANVELYVATDVGVFFKKDADTIWQYYGQGIPNTEISDIKIQYASNKLYISTYGRGIWETEKNTKSIPLAINKNEIKIANFKIVPLKNEIALEVTIENATTFFVNIYNTQGQLLYNIPWPATVGYNTNTIDSKKWGTGIYVITINDGKNKFSKKITINNE
jgi:photosystem II stability/assembly factor-like uncharacterized protein